MKTKLYTYVPPCPHCGSTVTGRFVNRDYIDKYIIHALKRGELVQPAINITERNLYCETCGFEWHGFTKLQILSKDELNEQKILRNIESSDYINYKQYLSDDKSEYKKQQRQAHSLWTKIKKFLGKNKKK